MGTDAPALDAAERSAKANLWYDMVSEWISRVDPSRNDPSQTAERRGERESESAELAAQVQNLKKALQTNRRIGAAVGILMSSAKLSEESAFDLLRHVSSQTGRKIRDIADEVVLTGALPQHSGAAADEPRV